MYLFDSLSEIVVFFSPAPYIRMFSGDNRFEAALH